MKLFQKSGGKSKARALIGEQVAARLDAHRQLVNPEVEGIQLYYGENFIRPSQCERLMQIIDEGRRPSTLLSDSPRENFRTSESCDLNRWAPDVRPIDEGIAELLGVDPAQGETMQGQRYAPGQHFRAHHDYFFETEGYWQKVKREGGQRTWTAMIYLNTVDEGGATWFPEAGIRIAPKRGLLLIWNNMNADGSPNQRTLHEGMAVTKGTKYVVTKWFREGNWLPD
ncbi:MAG: prolyl hydroxylase family protein [Sphingomonas sp.]